MTLFYTDLIALDHTFHFKSSPILPTMQFIFEVHNIEDIFVHNSMYYLYKFTLKYIYFYRYMLEEFIFHTIWHVFSILNCLVKLHLFTSSSFCHLHIPIGNLVCSFVNYLNITWYVLLEIQNILLLSMCLQIIRWNGENNFILTFWE